MERDLGQSFRKRSLATKSNCKKKKTTKNKKGMERKRREEDGKDESKLNVVSVRDDVSDLLFFRVFPSAMVPKVTESSFPCVPWVTVPCHLYSIYLVY